MTEIDNKNMERTKAKELALEMVNEEIAKYGEDHIIMRAPWRAPGRGKNFWTAKEIKESIINDTIPEGCTSNVIDDILHYHEYYEYKA